ncbi:hypothetical protein DEO72_LG5g2787 [Vigna unguiculata]|uniref:Uncharacterized protein n=1 Tax=Vigna unguiculata TaxID=3917 RepID=A0A4D6M0N9_VIGUN|nr:hypothetical protein DEO72_LG5g2787 [Vigna unguiculata]
MGSIEKDEEEEDENIKFSKRVMILISKSNQGSIPKSSVIDAERESSREFGPIWFFLIGAEEKSCTIATTIFFLPTAQGWHTVRRSCSETEVEIRLQEMESEQLSRNVAANSYWLAFVCLCQDCEGTAKK